MGNTAELMNFLINTAVDDGAVVIAPHVHPFRGRERDFLDGIRDIPARIQSPKGRDPFAEVLGKPGRWMFVWIPEK